MISDYTSLIKIAFRVIRQTPARLLWKFVWNFGWRNIWNMRSFENRMKNGEPFFPAFNMISVNEACNLSCSGCWVTSGGRRQLTPKQLDGIIAESKSKGSYFFGILGGEPLMYKGLLDVLQRHSDCYFLLFTNGTLLTDEVALKLKQLGNIAVLISVEGLEEESDKRRGRNDVYLRTLRGLRACRKAGVLFGAAASICRSNYDELVCREHLDRLAKEGAAYVWYYIYRPVGANPNPANSLTKEQIQGLRSFLVEQRRDAPLIIIDAYWDEEGRAICPGATGMSHHVSPSGALEFCPPLQMAMEFLNEDGSNLTESYARSSFLDDLRQKIAATTRGCILMDSPSLLAEILRNSEAKETTSRATFMQELEAMHNVPGHDMKEEAIPEKNPLYKLLKKKYFFGFGVYG